MKTHSLQSSFLAIAAITALAFLTGNVVAQDSSATTNAQPAAASQPAPKLSYGVPQILQLAQAKVSDGIIVQYVQNSGTIYTPTASEIIYLHQQGVSDIVLNAMLDQRRRLTGSTEPTMPAPAGSSAAQTAATTAAQPSVSYVETAPDYTPSSTVYVIPDTQTYDYDTYLLLSVCQLSVCRLLRLVLSRRFIFVRIRRRMGRLFPWWFPRWCSCWLSPWIRRRFSSWTRRRFSGRRLSWRI